jgi:hypothetical protein
VSPITPDDADVVKEKRHVYIARQLRMATGDEPKWKVDTPVAALKREKRQPI